jgi:hypothetical protein
MSIIAKLRSLTHAQFASILYRSKTDGSLARYTVILGSKYDNLLEKSKLELEIAMQTIEPDLKDAAQAVLDSLNKSITAHNNGTQSEDYTKKGQYIPLGNGLNLNETDGTLQLFGLVQSKVVIEEGTPKKPVKSSAMTIAKNKVRKMLPISKFREFALDAGNLQVVKVDGDILTLE